MVFSKQLRAGWGRLTQVSTDCIHPAFLSDVAPAIATYPQPLLAYGCGRSYGDVALNPSGGTLIMTGLNRFIAWNETNLELTCEAGVTLADIQSTFLPRGFGLITSPGTAMVTIGGAIANDVHGKNHDRVGSFGQHVVWLDLLLAEGDCVRCSRLDNPRLFLATLGGLGLTGIILKACIRLQKQSSWVSGHHEKIPTVSALIQRLKSMRDQHTYHVAWSDWMSARHFGRSILSTADPISCSQAPRDYPAIFVPPLAHHFLNKTTMQVHNAWHFIKSRSAPFQLPLKQFLYPLDHIRQWNLLYGDKGFYQFQCVIPDDSAESALLAMAAYIQKNNQKPFLCVIKTLGASGEGLMSFPLRGFTIALDFPNHPDTPSVMRDLETIAMQFHGRIYLAKDSGMRENQLPLMYPNLSAFQKIISDVDPHHKWRSLLAKRLKIGEWI